MTPTNMKQYKNDKPIIGLLITSNLLHIDRKLMLLFKLNKDKYKSRTEN